MAVEHAQPLESGSRSRLSQARTVVSVSEILDRIDRELPVAVAAELRRLRAENARLLRLLDLTATEAAPPGPAQAGFFDAPPGPVHANSAAEEKVAFFGALFAFGAARLTDVACGRGRSGCSAVHGVAARAARRRRARPTYAALKKLHSEAFGWSPPDVAGLERLGATRMRQYVRAWINEWDLLRLDPDFQPQTVAVTIASDYRENTALEETGDADGGEAKPD